MNGAGAENGVFGFPLRRFGRGGGHGFHWFGFHWLWHSAIWMTVVSIIVVAAVVVGVRRLRRRR